MSVADTEVSGFSYDGYPSSYDDNFNFNLNGEGEDQVGYYGAPPAPEEQSPPIFENEPRSNFVKNYLRDHNIDPGCDTITMVEDHYDIRIGVLNFENLMSRLQIEPVFRGEEKMLKFLTELFIFYDDEFMCTRCEDDRLTLKKIDDAICSWEIIARVQDISIPSYHTENHPIPSDEMD